MNNTKRFKNEQYFHQSFNMINVGGIYLWSDTGHIYTKVDTGDLQGRKWVMECDQKAYNDLKALVRPPFMKCLRAKKN